MPTSIQASPLRAPPIENISVQKTIKKAVKVPADFFETYEPMKAVVRVVSCVLTGLVKNTDASENLQSASEFFGTVKTFLGAVELPMTIAKLATGEPWKGKKLKEALLGTAALITKFVKNILETFKFVMQFITSAAPILFTAAKMCGPATSILDLFFSTFTAGKEGVKIHSTNKRIDKYKAKKLEWKQVLEKDCVKADKVDGKEVKIVDQEKLVATISKLASTRLYGIDKAKNDAGDDVAITTLDAYQVEINRLSAEIKKLTALKEDDVERKKLPESEKALQALQGSLIGRIDKKLELITEKSFSKKFLDKVANDSVEFKDEIDNPAKYFNGEAVQAIAKGEDLKGAVLAKLRDELKAHILSNDKDPRSTWLRIMMSENKEIAKFVKGCEKVHNRIRKWESLKNYANANWVDGADKGKALTKYVNDKIADKKREISENRRQLVKSWITVAFAVALFLVAAASVALFFSPISFAAAPILMFALTMTLSVVSTAKCVFTMYYKVKKKEELEYTQLPQFAFVKA